MRAALARLLPGRHRRNLRWIVSPRALLRGHAHLVRWPWTSSHCAAGRPRTGPAVRALVGELARANPGRGHRRSHGELTGRGHQLAPPAVGRSAWMRAPAQHPGRTGQTWRAFPGRPGDDHPAAGSFPAGTVLLRRLHVLVTTGHRTRRGHLAAITAPPAGEQVTQQARTLLRNP